jgi:hypothetical protein
LTWLNSILSHDTLGASHQFFSNKSEEPPSGGGDWYLQDALSTLGSLLLLLMVIAAPFDAVIAVFGFPVALATIYDIVRWRRKGAMKRLKRYLTKGSIIAASDGWVALAMENARGWGSFGRSC